MEERKDTQQYNRPEQKDLRRDLRKGGEAPEAVMWTLLKNRQLDGMRFRRQFGVGPYVLDFYCPEIKLGVELDGAPHFTFIGGMYDEEREKYIASQGITTLRYENKDIFKNPDGVIEEIENTIKKIKNIL